MSWLGLGCVLSSAGALGIVLYTFSNLKLRKRGIRASWLGGWILGAVGMTAMFSGWAALAVAGPHFDGWPLRALGVAVCLLAGLLYFVSASTVGRLKRESSFSLDLQTEGLYLLVRHPQALALSLLAVGVGLVSLSIPSLVSTPGWIGFWLGYTYLEEQFELIPAFGEEYRLYRTRTPRMVPSWSSWQVFRRWRRDAEKTPPPSSNQETRGATSGRRVRG